MCKSKNQEDTKYNLYLDDNPTNQDEFEYEQIADLLKDTIQKSNDFPMHISLMGEWGTGKSTVIKLLESKLENHKKIELKSFSVWKFSDNSTSLQRRIIRQVQNELGIDPSVPLGDKKEEKTTNTFATGLYSLVFAPFIENKKVASAYTILILLQVSILSLLFLSPVNSFVVILLSLLYSLFGMIGKSNIGIRVSNTSAINPLEHDDQFENEFKNTIKEYTKEKRLEKLILVFDDLDRLPPLQIYNALNTIKTFLKSDKCIFIVPCDEEVLRRDLQYVFESETKNSKVDVSEFLSKTFDVIIKMPLVEQNNMTRYAETLLIENEIEWYYDKNIKSDIYSILDILIHTEIDTPRKVKKNLNAFASDWYLAKQRDNGNVRNLLTTNPKELAIMTVIKTNYVELFKILKSNPLLFSNINNMDELEKRIQKELDSLMIMHNNTTKKENNEDITSDNVEGKTDVTVNDIISLSFLSRVFPLLPSDARPFLYFTNKKLNPITSVKSLNEVKESLVNADAKTFIKMFDKLQSNEKLTLFKNMKTEIMGDLVEKNVIKTLINYPETGYYARQIPFWEELLRKQIKYIAKNLEPKNVYGFLENMDAENYIFEDYGDELENFRDFQDIIDLWIEFPAAHQKLKINNLSEKVYEYTYELNDKFKSPYTIPKLIFSISENHPMAKLINWGGLLKDTINTIKNKNEEIEIFNNDAEDDDEIKKKIPFELDFNLLDWITNVNSKSNGVIGGYTLKHVITELFNELEDDSLFEGVGQYWESILETSKEESEIIHLIEFIKNQNELANKLFSDKVFYILNEKGKNNQITDEVQDLIYELLNFYNDEDKDDMLLTILDKMKDVDVVTTWAVDNYSVSDTVLDENIEELIIHNDQKVDLELLYETIDEEFNINNITALNAIEKLITNSELLFNYGENKGYFEKWFNINPEKILYINANHVKKFLNLNGYTCQNVENHNEFLIDTIKTLLKKSHMLEHNQHPIQKFPYRNQWKHHLRECFLKLVRDGHKINWSETLNDLKSIQLENHPNNQTISIFDKLDKSVISEAIPDIDVSSPINDDEINSLIISNANLKNIYHVKAISNRWRNFSLEARAEAVDKMSDDFYKEFIQKLTEKFKHQPELSYIDELQEENIYEIDKEKLLDVIIENVPFKQINKWIEEKFSSVTSQLTNWEYIAIEKIMKHYNSLDKLGYTFVRDALTVKNNKTEMILKLIPKMFQRKDAKEAKPYLRELILTLEEDEVYSELATEAKNVFGWKNRKKQR